ncbi:MAG: GNAT family N-acetyltransferase [Bdellovibrio sp.]
MNPTHLKEKLETERLILKRHHVDEAETMFRAIDSDRGRLSTFLPWPSKILTVEDERDFLLQNDAWWESCELFDYSIYTKEKNIYVGNLGVHTINWKNDCCELGYWLLGDFEGQGFMREAVSALESHLFDIGFNRIEIRCEPTNLRSTRVPGALGYSYEGLLRENIRREDRYRDTLVYSKIKSQG